MRRIAILLVVAVMASGCYHAVVHTGPTPAARVVEEPWAKGFLWGLLGPDEVDGAAACGGDVSRVETELSFLNSLVAGITLGIYTPMTIRVVCGV